eukprot:TRINITY_DN6164_c0_g1_i5.p1 TRINITY_DN6164_c0_g1~~TRINITY_DN6164_c0_g1_i5.p1  ORF type:complete len:196 (+),score=22.95 TRINITY_DN6164_c0_g1_i5:64-651(+)
MCIRDRVQDVVDVKGLFLTYQLIVTNSEEHTEFNAQCGQFSLNKQFSGISDIPCIFTEYSSFQCDVHTKCTMIIDVADDPRVKDILEAKDNDKNENVLQYYVGLRGEIAMDNWEFNDFVVYSTIEVEMDISKGVEKYFTRRFTILGLIIIGILLMLAFIIFRKAKKLDQRLQYEMGEVREASDLLSLQRVNQSDI